MNIITPAPRLHVLLARKSPYAVIIRRGPAKITCTIGWNRETDEMLVGQWFKGRIYEGKADLSPDGKHLIYFAGNYKFDTETNGTWTAISVAPYIKAISLWPVSGTYHGGGLFLNDSTVFIHGGHHDPLHYNPQINAVTDVRSWGKGDWTRDYKPPKGIKRINNLNDYLTKAQLSLYESDINDPYASYRDFEMYRAGWRLNPAGCENETDWHFGKHATQDWWLRKPYYDNGYQIIHKKSDKVVDLPGDSSWADCDVWGKWKGHPNEVRIVWTCCGCLFSGHLNAQGLHSIKQLYDFTPMEFEPLKAPY